MRIEFHRHFEKAYVKLPTKVKDRFEERLRTFRIDPFHETLRNHSLHGDWEGCRSLDVTGDFRAIYEEPGEDVVKFVAIGTHSQLYG